MFRFQMNTKEKAKTNWQDVERNSGHSDVRQYYPEMQINLFNFEKCWFNKNSWFTGWQKDIKMTENKQKRSQGTYYAY